MLLSYDKIVLFQQLLDSDVPEDPYLSKELVRYFPQPLQEKLRQAMESHRLRREIIATAVTNSMVNRMGATFAAAHAGRHRPQRRRRSPRPTPSAARRWTRASCGRRSTRSTARCRSRRRSTRCRRSGTCMRTMTRWLLSRPGAMPDIATAMARYGDGLKARARGAAGTMLGRPRRAGVRRQPRATGRPRACRPTLADAAGGAAVAGVRLRHRRGRARAQAVAGRGGQGATSRLGDGAAPAVAVRADRGAAGRRPLARAGARRAARRTEAQQRALVGQILADGGKKPAEAKVEAWLERDDAALRFTQAMLTDLLNQKTLDYPTAVGRGAPPGADRRGRR